MSLPTIRRHGGQWNAIRLVFFFIEDITKGERHFLLVITG